MSKYTYKTETDKDGNAIRYRCWIDNFEDMDTGKYIPIKRQRPIKLNGDKLEWYSNREIKGMSKADRDKVFNFNKKPS